MKQDELEVWRSTRPLADSITIAYRAALRVMPNWARRGDLESLLVLRPVLTSGVARIYQTPELKIASHSAFIAVGSAAGSAVRSSARSAALSAHSSATIAAAHSVGFDRLTAAAYSAESAGLSGAALYNSDSAHISAEHEASSAAWQAIESDVASLIRGDDPFELPIWQDDVQEWFVQARAGMLMNLAVETGDLNSFWSRWWLAAESGTPLDWSLQRDVALIPDEVWQAGPKAVIAAIAEIEARFALKAEVVALRLQLQQYEATAILQASAVQRSHNQPPELIEPEIAAGRQISVMIGALIEAEEELAKPDPKPGLLTRIAEVLVQGAKAIALYCGSLADVALKKAAEEVGSTGMKWGLRVGGLTVASQLEPIKNVVKALVDFVKDYHGG